jgi:predicted O-linked N-acetylglucosamine transferase (SPINDLY family)
MLPQAKLLLKTKEFIDSTNRQRVVVDFAKRGIEGSRIELHDRSSTPDWHSHMAFYNQLDVVLDVAGANRGAATTCDSLWMGLPVITLTGNRVAERTSAALLNSIGRNEFVAKNDDEFVSIAHRVAYDVALRKEIRTGQRERMRLSPICDGKGLAMALEDAFEAMHERWRNG